MARVLINVPKEARRGEVVEIKLLIAHPMETGYRPDASGRVMPRNIIRHVTCRYGEEEVFRADLFPAIAANPFLAFTTVAIESGTLTFTFEGDEGFSQTETAMIRVV
jgi:sulfur-oxidizing protein SoxZ